MKRLMAVVLGLLFAAPVFAIDGLWMTVWGGTRKNQPDASTRITPGTGTNTFLFSDHFTFAPSATPVTTTLAMELRNAHPTYPVPVRIVIHSFDPATKVSTYLTNQELTIEPSATLANYTAQATVPAHAGTIYIQYGLIWGNSTSPIPAAISPIDVRSVTAGGQILQPGIFPQAAPWITPSMLANPEQR